jgi:hypothetical protein
MSTPIIIVGKQCGNRTGMYSGGSVKKIAGLMLPMVLMLSQPVHAGSDAVARIKTAKGACSIVRDGKMVATKTGADIFRNDSLKTGTDGSLALQFRDDTLISIGPGSEVVINEFLYSPDAGKFSLVTRLLKGTAAYISGAIGKLSPESVRFETPDANIGIRGTKFAVKLEKSE